MIDARLRDLERAWRASGALDDEVALLREAVRLGRVDRERLALAAWCDHEAAALALGDPSSRASSAARSWDTRPDPVRLPVLARWGRDALVRGAIAAARLALDRGDALVPVRAGAREVLGAAEGWARAPEAEAAATARARLAAFMRASESDRGPAPVLWVAPAVLAALCVAQPDVAGRCETAAVDALAHSTGSTRDVAARAVWEAVAREVVPWALGRGDPLAARSP